MRESGSRPWRRGGELLALAAGAVRVCVCAHAAEGGWRGESGARGGKREEGESEKSGDGGSGTLALSVPLSLAAREGRQGGGDRGKG